MLDVDTSSEFTRLSSLLGDLKMFSREHLHNLAGRGILIGCRFKFLLDYFHCESTR